MRMYYFVCLVCFCHCLVTRYVRVCVCFHSSCLTGALGAWEDLCPFAGLLTAGLACFPSLSLGASLSALYSGRLWRERLMDNENGRKGETSREGEEKKGREEANCPSAHFLLMDKANSRRQCCRQIWIFFITWTHALICWGWQRQKHGYFFFYSGLLPSILRFFFLWKQAWFGHYLSGFQGKCWLVSI